MFKEVYGIGVYITIVIRITGRHLLQQFVSVFRDMSSVCPVVCIPVDECTRLSLYLIVVQFLVCVCVCVCVWGGGGDEFFSPVELRTNASYGLLILEVSKSHTTTHHSW